jgi:hypothetical protein
VLIWTRTEIVFKTMVFSPSSHLTQLIAWENFITFISLIGQLLATGCIHTSSSQHNPIWNYENRCQWSRKETFCKLAELDVNLLQSNVFIIDRLVYWVLFDNELLEVKIEWIWA